MKTSLILKDKRDSLPFQTLLSDLVENILRYSDNPGACAQYITNQIREIIGVRIVALISIDENAESALVGICPQKRVGEWSHAGIQTFIDSLISSSSGPRLIDPATDSEGSSLLSAGIGKSFVIPLSAGDERVGMLILLGLMDESGAGTILDALTRVSSVLSLILKSSLLYKNLERRVDERTAELLQKNAELNESEERFAQLAEQSRTFTWEVDCRGLYIYVSDVSETVIGYHPDELVWKKHFYDIHPDKGREEFMKNAFEAFERKERFKDFVNPIRTKDNRIVWVNTNALPLLNPDGTLRGYRGGDTDITGRMQAEKELRQNREDLDRAQEVGQIGSWRFNIQKNELIWSDENHRIFGIPKGIPLTYETFLDTIHPDDRQYVDTQWQAGLRGEPYDIEHRLLVKGQVKWVREKAFLEFDEKGTLLGGFGITQNITDRKKMEEEKLLMEQQFQQAQKLESLGVLAGGIAHDFNNILTIITGYCGLTRKNYKNAEKNIPKIEKAAERAAELCHQMLAYAGKAQFTRADVDIRELLDEMITMLKATINQKIDIKADFASDIPDIIGDASQLRQVVMNLIINGAEAIGETEGEILVSLSNWENRAGKSEMDHMGMIIPAGRYVLLEVADNGCGMNAEIRNRVFEPFYTTKFAGRGLGMSAVLGIIKTHNAALQLFSREGSGTTFKIYLPLLGSSFEAGATKNGDSEAEWQGKGTVLLVEDEEQIKLIAVEFIEALGFKVISASNGREALELFRENASEISIVVTDMGMPVMSGYELFCELKRRKPQLPVVISSGFGESEITSKIPRRDIAGIINKPYSLEHMRKILKNVVQRGVSG